MVFFSFFKRPGREDGTVVCKRTSCNSLRGYAWMLPSLTPCLTLFTERACIIKSSQSQAQCDMDDAAPRYVINIAYPPTGEEAPFTTRGTYRVKKVLAGACKSFGLDFERYDFCALSWLLFRIFFLTRLRLVLV